MTWTHTSRGRALDLLDPQPDDVSIDEIALALGNQCRYAGCIARFYSVAEHSVLIACHLEREGHAPDVVLAGLLHDAAEAYTGDITWPMQEVLFGEVGDAGRVARKRYKSVQGMLDLLICALVGLDPDLLHCDAVKVADLRILLDERDALLVGRPRPWGIEEAGLRPLGVEVAGLLPTLATWRWTRELRRIQSERGRP